MLSVKLYIFKYLWQYACGNYYYLPRRKMERLTPPIFVKACSKIIVFVNLKSMRPLPLIQ